MMDVMETIISKRADNLSYIFQWMDNTKVYASIMMRGIDNYIN